jgi:hypothetical protein
MNARRFRLAAALACATGLIGCGGPTADPAEALPSAAAARRLLSITPAAPRTGDDLVATTELALLGARVVWARADGLLVDGAQVPASLTQKGERWTARTLLRGAPITEASVTIQNTPPRLRLRLPDTARRGGRLEAIAEVNDLDRDHVDLRWLWSVDGVVQPDLTEASVPGDRLHPGQSWIVELRADDGEIVVGAQAGPLVVTEPGAWLLDTPDGRHVDLTLRPAALRSLRDAPETWVEATLSVDGLTLPRVGVRLKGRGSFRPIDDRPCLLIDTDLYVPDQRLDGLDELALHNMLLDPAGAREQLSYAMFRAAGMPAPRATHALVTIDGSLRGLYTLSQVVDGRFLDSWFGDGEGPLFEMFNAELQPDHIVRLDHDGGPDDRAAIEALAAILADPTRSLSVDAAHLIDVREVARYLALTGVIAHYDGYPHNAPGDDLYLYVSPADGKIHLIPHGADEAFNDAYRPIDYAPGLLAQRCLQETPCRDLFITYAWTELDRLEGFVRDGAAITILNRAMSLLWEPAAASLDADAYWAAQEELDLFLMTRRARLSEMLILR